MFTENWYKNVQALVCHKQLEAFHAIIWPLDWPNVFPHALSAKESVVTLPEDELSNTFKNITFMKK